MHTTLAFASYDGVLAQLTARGGPRFPHSNAPRRASDAADDASITRLHMAPRNNNMRVAPAALLSAPTSFFKNHAPKLAGTAAAVGSTSSIALAAMGLLLIGFLLGRGSRPRQRLTNAGDETTTTTGHQRTWEDTSTSTLTIGQEDGSTPLWLNYALSRMWALFQKNTKRLIQDTIQPVLDETEKPEFVTAVRLTKFVPGRQSPFVRSLKRLATRAIAEVQYSFRTKFSSTSVFRFEVDVQLADRFNLTIPVTMQDLDVDAVCWASFALVPYEPFCTSAQFSLLEPPVFSFDMTIAGLLPITAVPVLRSFFFRVVTQEIPKEFLFPKTAVVDFTPEIIEAAHQISSPHDVDGKTDQQLMVEFAEQWSLFDALDLDSSGFLSGVELFTGLKDWGYTAGDASECFSKLDKNSDDKVSFREFCIMWPQLASSFVPSRYKGALTIFVRRADDIRQPRVGSTDPYVQIRLGEQQVSSKCDSQTSGRNKTSPLWMESFELNSEDIKKEELQITVMEGNRWVVRGGKEIGTGKVPLASLAKSPSKQEMEVKLEPQGSVWLDLFYADFVVGAKPIHEF